MCIMSTSLAREDLDLFHVFGIWYLEQNRVINAKANLVLQGLTITH